MYPFSIAPPYCTAHNQSQAKLFVCCEKQCPNRGLVCSECVLNDHYKHQTVGLEAYIDQLSKLFSSSNSTNQPKLFEYLDRHSLKINKQIAQTVESLYSLHKLVNEQLSALTHFQMEQAAIMMTIKDRFWKVCETANSIRTPKSPQEPNLLFPNILNDFTQDTLDLVVNASLFECKPKKTKQKKRFKSQIFSDSSILKDQPLFQRFENAFNYSRIAEAEINKTTSTLKLSLENYFKDMKSQLDILPEKISSSYSCNNTQLACNSTDSYMIDELKEIQQIIEESKKSESHEITEPKRAKWKFQSININNSKIKQPKQLSPFKRLMSPLIPVKNTDFDVVAMFQSKPKSIRVIQRATNTKIQTIRGICSTDGSSIFATITDNGMQIWDYRTGHKIRLIPGVKYAIHIEKHKVIACCDGDQIKIISIANNYRVLRVLKTSNISVIRLCYEESVECLYSTGNSGKIEVWDMLKGQLITTIGDGQQQLLSVTYASIFNQSLLYYGDKEGSITVYDLHDRIVLSNIKTHDQVFYLKVLQIRQQFLLVSVASQRITIMDPLTLKEIKRQILVDFINSAMIVADTLFFTVGNEGVVFLMKIDPELNFPISSTKLQYSTERFALCWIEKSRTLIYNAKSVKPRRAFLQNNNLLNVANGSNINNNNSFSNIADISENSQNPVLLSVIDQGFSKYLNVQDNSLYSSMNNSNVHGDDIIICQY